ncbi:hypothetical protein IFM89_025688, partial [Coptis chinensis]
TLLEKLKALYSNLEGLPPDRIVPTVGLNIAVGLKSFSHSEESQVQKIDDGNYQPTFVSFTTDNQNWLKSKKKPSVNTNWPPADWKTAPDFPQENCFRKKPAVLPPSDRLEIKNQVEGITCTEDHGVPVGAGVDWII